MNFDEAMSQAVLGARVTCNEIGEGVYVAYNFNGWRIHHGDMASSGFEWRDTHKAAEWRIVEIEPPKPKPNVWGRPRIALGEAGVPAKLNECHCGSKIAAAYCCGNQVPEPKPGEASGARAALARRMASNVGTKAEPLSGLALARLERAKAAEPLPETPAPAKPWGAPAAKPWGPGK